jgi:5-methylcytosine-specific restriction endonuclease McrBC GTP-binding regulatory subunit McrB
LQDEVEKCHIDLKNAQVEIQKVVEEKQVILALKAKAEQSLMEARAELEEKKTLDASTCNMHKCLRLQAEKDRDKLKEEKNKLEYTIYDLLKQKEENHAKVKQIKEICDLIE